MRPIGIDLGTTNSVVSIFEKGEVRTLAIDGQTLVPSVVGWHPVSRELLVGIKAKNRILVNPELTISSNKRFMGDREKVYRIFDKIYTPIDIGAFLLKYLVEAASATLGYQVKDVVITVPAYFNQNQKEDTKLAAEMAGLNVLQLQAEPTAAAIFYGFNREKNQRILVYDLGGGTFDVSILELKNNSFQVLGLGGDVELGGDNFDEAISDYIIKQILLELDIDVRNDSSSQAIAFRQKIKEIAEEAKVELSSARETEIFLPSVLDQGSLEITLSRDKFEDIIYPYLDKTISVLEAVLADVNISKDDDINRVICVGGSTKIPAITEILTSKVKRPFMASNVDQAVAQGAAITAASFATLDENEDEFLPDFKSTNKTPLDLGVRLEGDVMGVIISRLSELPHSGRREFTTAVNNAKETDIIVYQGNESLCANNVCLGKFTLSGIKKAAAGQPKIEVSFKMDSSDLLTIEARDTSTNAKNTLTIEHFDPQPLDLLDPPKQKNIEELVLGVSKVGYDDVGAILRELRLPWSKVKNQEFRRTNRLRRFDVLFINCLSGGNACENSAALREFVANGGVLYASDCAYEHINEAFPNAIRFESNSSFNGSVRSRIEDENFIQLIGTDRMNITFNSVCYYADEVEAEGGKVFISGEYGITEKPIVVGFPYEKGYVLFTAFHNYGGCSKEEKELLKYVLLQAVSEVTKTPLVEIADQIK